MGEVLQQLILSILSDEEYMKIAGHARDAEFEASHQAGSAIDAASDFKCRGGMLRRHWQINKLSASAYNKS
jgi:hypothetical protein